jgi:hypothetical protein
LGHVLSAQEKGAQKQCTDGDSIQEVTSKANKHGGHEPPFVALELAGIHLEQIWFVSALQSTYEQKDRSCDTLRENNHKISDGNEVPKARASFTLLDWILIQDDQTDQLAMYSAHFLGFSGGRDSFIAAIRASRVERFVGWKALTAR